MYQSEMANIAQAQAAHAYAQQYGYPMRGYSSPEQIEAARMSAAYYAGRPGGMRGSYAFEDRPGALTDNIVGQTLGDLGEAFDSKSLMYAAAGAVAGAFLMKGNRTTSAGIGALVGFAASKFL